MRATFDAWSLAVTGLSPCFTGDQFALSEAVVALAMLMRRFELSMDPEAPTVSMTTVGVRMCCAHLLHVTSICTVCVNDGML